MKILVIDSHKGSVGNNNLHFRNAKTIAKYLDADLIWSFKGVNDHIKSDYDVIIFVHASSYSFESREWIEQSPNAKLIYITNEYNLGEPLMLWKYAKEKGIKYDVIANHSQEASKVVNKYVRKWHETNLNALCVNDERINAYQPTMDDLTGNSINQLLYWGSIRKGRMKYFRKYFGEHTVISTHKSNFKRFNNEFDLFPICVGRIDWNDPSISQKYSLYIEDEHTHTHYNRLANRFYESVNMGITPLFDSSCVGTIKKSGYQSMLMPFVIDGINDMLSFNRDFDFDSVHQVAKDEKRAVLAEISRIVSVVC